MKKSEMIDLLVEEVESVKCNFTKVYGVSFGIGYDMIIETKLKSGKEFGLKVHAVPRSHACAGHLRENQVDFNNYKGSKQYDYYMKAVSDYWEKSTKTALHELFNKSNKTRLQTVINIWEV